MLSVVSRSFIFGPFLPVLFGATNSELTCSRRLHEWRGITHSPCGLNHRLAAAAIGWFKKGWAGIRRPEPALSRAGYGGWSDKDKEGPGRARRPCSNHGPGGAPGVWRAPIA
jgi:hypothetical protein